MNGIVESKNQRFKRLGSFLVLSVLAFGCAQATDATVVTACNLPSDQSGTLSGYWNLKPVPIAFHTGDFTAAEMTAMTTAADTWNRFFSASQKFAIIDYGTASSPRISANAKPASPCTESIVGTQYSAPVVIYKDSTWTYGTSTIALTRFCTNTSATTTIKPMTMAYIEVNYQNYFVSGQEIPDLQSIVLHEMGHLSGLNHSCENIAASGVPNCASSTTYTDAVMAPVFTFDTSGNGQQKRTLTANDEGRANCLYDGGITGTTTK